MKGSQMRLEDFPGNQHDRQEAKMSNLEIIADDGNLCGEGPIWDEDNACLYWTDILGRQFYRYEWKARQHALLRKGFEISGFALDEAGGFVAVNSSGVWYWDGAGDPRLIVNRVGDEECRLNDCIADPKGRLLAGSCWYEPEKGYRLGKLISVDREGNTRVVDEGFHLSNGLGFSPDCRSLYFTDSVARIIYRYDYDAQEGTVSNRGVFVRVPSSQGLPDGLTVDAEGFVWSAQWYGSCVVRYDPDGKVERQIETPAKQTSSLAFGGPDLTDIFITTAAKSEPMPVMPPNYNPQSGFFGGPLYRINLGIQGRPEFKTRIHPATVQS